MKVYTVYKNDSIIKGRLFALPEQAFNFFCEEFTKIFPNAQIEDVAEELKTQLNEEGYISIQTGNDEYGIKTYISIQ